MSGGIVITPQAKTKRSQIAPSPKREHSLEHVFGSWVMQMGSKLVRSIGIVRVKAQLGLKNLTYNLIRYTFLETKAVS